MAENELMTEGEHMMTICNACRYCEGFCDRPMDWRSLGEWRARRAAQGLGVNVAPFLGFGTIRASVMGQEGGGGERFAPSAAEVAAMEAMALGRPVVATSVGGVPEVVADGETGLLVEPGDPEALAKAVLKLLADGDRARDGKRPARLAGAPEMKSDSAGRPGGSERHNRVPQRTRTSRAVELNVAFSFHSTSALSG